MKTTPKQKINKSLKFIEQLKTNPKIIPFLEPDQMERLGLFDFKFVTRKTIKLAHIQQRIKQNKYQQFEELLSDLRLVFQMISYYVPLNDPLQNDVKHFINQIEKWKSQCQGTTMVDEAQTLRSGQKTKQTQASKQSFSNKNQKHYQSQRKKKELNYATLQQQQVKTNTITKAYRLPVRSTLAQKLQMTFFLRAHQTNEPFIHMIGDMYGIGKQTDDQYVIKLDNSTCCSWLEVLQNTQQIE